jgi:tRNA A-37 threonylcarbamoyl transferase component Bud32
MALSAGSNIGPYRIIEPIGRGGMASVFKAYEASLDRYVALKVLPPEFLHDPTFAERFRREAQTIAKLEHPQIIPIFAYDIDAETGTPWMAMRLISGGSLSQRIKRGRLAPSECARILKDVADALDYAHGAGVIHRDVKPQNVLLDDSGRVYLADFGIAKMIEASAHMTQTGMITGTPQYMAPEQALGKSIDKSIDIYALGIVAYELFTGRVPFSADTPVAVLMKQASEPMPLPPVSEVQEEVTRAILRATAKDPSARWPTASAFARAVTNATTMVGAVAPTGMMAPLSQETVAGMTAPILAAGGAETVAGRTALSKTAVSRPAAAGVKPVQPSRGTGAGIGVAALVLVGLALAGATVTYFGFRYWQRTQTPSTVASAETPSPLPVAPATPVPQQTPPAAAVTTPAGTPVPEPTPLAPTAGAVTSPTPDAAEELRELRDSLTPAQRKALMSMPRRERMAAIAAHRKRLEAGTPSAGAVPTTLPQPAAPARPARTKIILEVEASQPSTGAQISALYAQVIIDDRPFRDFVIRFSGGNSFARWKKVENIVLENVPLSAREITLAVATDPGLNEERMEGSTRLSLEGEETNLSVVVRFYNQFDKSVRFR